MPYGLNEQHPNNYTDIAGFDLGEPRQSRLCLSDSARRLLRRLFPRHQGMHDWTMKGIHLCAVRLQLLRLNTMPAMDWHQFEDVGPLQ